MRNSRTKRTAYIAIGLLCRISITVVAGAVAAAIGIPALKDAQRMECRYNMIAIGNLLRVHRIKDPNHKYVSSVADLKNETLPAPTCPDGGKYTITISDGTAIAQNGQIVPAGEPIVSCSSPRHGKYALDIDIK